MAVNHKDPPAKFHNLPPTVGRVCSNTLEPFNTLPCEGNNVCLNSRTSSKPCTCLWQPVETIIFNQFEGIGDIDVIIYPNGVTGSCVIT